MNPWTNFPRDVFKGDRFTLSEPPPPPGWEKIGSENSSQGEGVIIRVLRTVFTLIFVHLVARIGTQLLANTDEPLGEN